MKKIAIAALMALAAATAGAVELGVNGSADSYNGHTRDGFGLTVGEHFGAFSVTAGADRYIKNNMDKFSLVGGYDVTKLGTATLTAKAGVGFLDKQGINGSDRYVGLVGAGLTVPVTKQVGLTVDYRYQYGNDAAKPYNGNTVAVGAKYAF
jgi:opacity protein-like surface antigen